jgi:hypothetical protein
MRLPLGRGSWDSDAVTAALAPLGSRLGRADEGVVASTEVTDSSGVVGSIASFPARARRSSLCAGEDRWTCVRWTIIHV